MTKKVLFSALFAIFLSVSAFGQVNLSLKFAPLISSNRINFSSATFDVERDGTNPKLSLGLLVDKVLTDTYSFSTGLVYLPKGISIVAQENGGGLSFAESYRLQYLQIPLTFKLFTNEVSPGLKVYFQVGGGLEILINNEPEDDDNVIIEDFNFLDFSVLLGGGVEYKLGASTILYGGLSYQRGLLDVVGDTFALGDELQIRNTVVSLDLGIKF